MNKRTICAAALIWLFLLPPHQALAHSGGTDRHGCHTNSRTGDYHCHNRKDDDGKDRANWAVIGGVAGGALLLWLIVKQLDRGDKTAAAARLRIVPYLAEGNRVGIATEYALGRAGAVGVRAVPPSREGRERGHVGGYWRLRF